MRALLALGLGGVLLALVAKKKKPKAATPTGSPPGPGKPSGPGTAPTGLAAETSCFSQHAALTSAEVAAIKAVTHELVDHGGTEIPGWSQATSTERALAAANATMRHFCPDMPVPGAMIHVGPFRESNGIHWAKAHKLAYQLAAGRLLPPVT